MSSNLPSLNRASDFRGGAFLKTKPPCKLRPRRSCVRLLLHALFVSRWSVQCRHRPIVQSEIHAELGTVMYTVIQDK